MKRTLLKLTFTFIIGLISFSESFSQVTEDKKDQQTNQKTTADKDSAASKTKVLTTQDSIKLQLTELTKNVNAIKEKVDPKEDKSKYTLDPDSMFFGFSTGSSFDLIDGVDETSLFLDLTANLGQILGKRWTGEVGVLNGKFSPSNIEEPVTVSRTLMLENLGDSARSTRIRYEADLTNIVNEKFTRAFAQLNFRIRDTCTHKKSKIYASIQTSYNRIEFEATTIETATSPIDTITSIIRDSRPDAMFNVSINDTTKSRIIQDRVSLSMGTKLFKTNKDFDFFIGAYIGYTWVKRLSSQLNSATDQRSIERGALQSVINSESRFSYLLQASILEKKVIGAKIGFELSDRIGIENEAPDYYFFVSKQFTIQEFFRLFSPKKE